MALHFETYVPGGMMILTIEGNTIAATFDYPAAFGDRTHELPASDTTLETFCQSETVTVDYDDFNLEADAVVIFTDTATGKGYRWNVEHPDKSGWIEPTPDPRRGLPWWLTTARNALRP